MLGDLVENDYTVNLKWKEPYGSIITDDDYYLEYSFEDIDQYQVDRTYTVTIRGYNNYTGKAIRTITYNNIIPFNAQYNIASTGETVTGDGLISFPELQDGDTFIDCCEKYINSANNIYTYHGFPYDSWSVKAYSDIPRTIIIKSGIADRSVTNMDYYSQGFPLFMVPSTVVIPDSITSMNYAFENANFENADIDRIVIPSTVYSMKGAFKNSDLKVAPIIPNTITDLSDVFYGCASLVTYSGSEDPDGDFSNYKISAGVTNMNYTFSGCTALTEAPVIPNGVTDMTGTFHDCSSLTTAPVIPDSVTDMYESFYECTSLKSASAIGNNVTNLGNTFSGCTALTEAPVIPGSVTNMGSTFYGCTALSGTLVCNANPTSYSYALRGTKITAIEGSCPEETKAKLLATR